MNVLYVNACIRGAESRTRRIADSFFNALDAQFTVTEHQLDTMRLPALDHTMLAFREQCCDHGDFSSEFFKPVHDFMQSDVIVIAAPYWDLSFPSCVKVWVEHMFVRNYTFLYKNDLPVGLSHASECIYITTAGSMMGGHNWGELYLQDALRMLGIPKWTAISAEGLDMAGAQTEQILQNACRKAKKCAKTLIDSVSASC